MTQFTIETVDGPNTVAGQCCLKLDSQGNPWIAYAAIGGKLMLASRNSGTWTREELFGAGRIGESDSNRVCLEIDSEGNPHIAFRDLNSGNLLYGVKRNNSWTYTPVPTRLLLLDPGSVAHYAFRLHLTHIHSEHQNTPHFVYHDLSTNQLGYTRIVGGQFKLITAASADGINFKSGLYTSMDFEPSSGTVLIAYIRESVTLDDDDDMPPFTKVCLRRIVRPFAGTLGEEKILDEGQFRVVRPTSVASNDGSPQPCVTYEIITDQKLYAVDPGVEQISKKVIATTVFPVVPSAAVASRGEYRVAFGDDNKLKLATQNRFNQWFVEVADPDGGDMPSLAYDKSGRNGHIAYSVRRTLKYAKWVEVPS